MSASPSTLRILMTHDCYPPDVRGGGEYVVRRTAEELQALGHQVRILTTGDPAIVEHGGVPTLRLPMRRVAIALAYAPILRAAREADIIHTFTYAAAVPSLLVARRLGLPIVCGILALFGSEWRAMRGPMLGRLLEAVERFIVTRRYDATVFLSEASRRRGLALGAPAETSMVLPPGIEFDRFVPQAPKQPIVLFAGRFDRRKGFPTVIEAARRLPDVVFEAVGWADDLETLRAEAPANLRLIEGRGEVYRAALARALVFLFPSAAETFGIVVAEAMASGCAIVSSLDTIRFEGRQVSSTDIDDIVAAIRDMVADPVAAAELGRRNRALAARFDWPSHAAALEDCYRDVIARKCRRAESIEQLS